MTSFSPTRAATEGLRVIRREPTALLGWIAVWVLALVVVGMLQAVTMTPAQFQAAPAGGLRGLMARFGPLAPVLVGTLLILWIMTTATLFRAVLRPQEHGWHLFKLGADEARLGVLTAFGSLLLVTLGSGPAVILWLFAQPVLAAAPASGRWVVAIGTLGTVAIELWLAVRLSLAAVHTFAEGRFHFVGYWRLTHGQFWRLLITYLIVIFEVVLLLIAVGLIVVLLSSVVSWIGPPHGVDLLRRALLLGLVGVAALLSSILFVVPLTLVCACQALAYAAIVKPDPASPWSASRGGARTRRHARVPGEKV